MTEYEKLLLDHLRTFLTPERAAKFTEVLENRTDKLVVVLVDLCQEHNASAVLRTCEAFGVQRVCVVEQENQFVTKRDIAMGTDRWLTIQRYGGPEALETCLGELREEGLRIVATGWAPEKRELEQVPISAAAPVAVLFGTEKSGLPSVAFELADEVAYLPMSGFVESFNVSVAAALSLHILTSKLKQAGGEWGLSEEQQQGLWLKWTRKSVPNSAAIERRFRKTFADSSQGESG